MKTKKNKNKEIEDSLARALAFAFMTISGYYARICIERAQWAASQLDDRAIGRAKAQALILVGCWRRDIWESGAN